MVRFGLELKASILMHYESDRAIRSLGESLIACTLPVEQWSHAAHCSLAIYLLLDRPEINPAEALPLFIRRYNESVGVENSDTEGYHETITQFYLLAFKAALLNFPEEISLKDACNTIISSEVGTRKYPLKFYSRELLFSVEARRGWVEPDLAPFDFDCKACQLFVGSE